MKDHLKDIQQRLRDLGYQACGRENLHAGQPARASRELFSRAGGNAAYFFEKPGQTAHKGIFIRLQPELDGQVTGRSMVETWEGTRLGLAHRRQTESVRTFLDRTRDDVRRIPLLTRVQRRLGLGA